MPRIDFYPPDICKLLRPFIAGKVVHDMGAAWLDQTKLLLQLGARQVTAVDSRYHDIHARPRYDGFTLEVPVGVELVSEDLRTYAGQVDVAFVSWPWVQGRVEPPWLATANTIIVIAVNDESTACKCPGLYPELLRRELLTHTQFVQEDFLVVGRRLESPRTPTPADTRGLQTAEGILELETVSLKDWWCGALTVWDGS